MKTAVDASLASRGDRRKGGRRSERVRKTEDRRYCGNQKLISSVDGVSEVCKAPIYLANASLYMVKWGMNRMSVKLVELLNKK